MTTNEYPEVVVDSEGIGVIVDDWEVYDFLDDLFVNEGLVPSSMRDRQSGTGLLFEIRFASPTTLKQVMGVLNKVAPSELAAIRAINN